MRTLRLFVLILACYLVGTVTADLLLPWMCEASPAASAGDVAHLGDTHSSVLSSRTEAPEAPSEL